MNDAYPVHSEIISANRYLVNRNSDPICNQNSDMDTFGERLRQARKAAKLTQAAAAKKAGMSQPALSELESGRYPSSTFTAQLAHVYGINARWLAEGRGARDSDTPSVEVSETDAWPFATVPHDVIRSLPQTQRIELERMMQIMIRGFFATSQDTAGQAKKPAIDLEWQQRDDPLLHRDDTHVTGDRSAGGGAKRSKAG